MKCRVCGDEVPEDSRTINQDAHIPCLSLLGMLHAALAWCPESIKDRIKQHARRAVINLEAKL